MPFSIELNEKKQFVLGGIIGLIALILSIVLQQAALFLVPIAFLAALLFLKDIRIPFLFLIFSLAFSFNLEETIGFNIDFPDEALMLILTACFVFFALYNSKKIEFIKILKNPLVIIIVLSFIWMCVTVVYSQNPLLSSKYMVKRIWYLVPFLFLPIILFQEKKILLQSFKLILIPLLAIAVLILIRYQALDFRFEVVGDPLQPFFINHVIYGGMLSCFFPFIVAALFKTKLGSSKWFFLVFSTIVFLVAIYFSYSRAAWMAVLFSAITFVFIRFRIMHYAFLFFYAIVLCGILFLASNNTYLNYRPKFEKTIMHESLIDHIMATIQGTDISSAERYYRWIAGIRMSVDHPIVGVGPNNFYDYYKHYTITSYRTWVSRNPERSTTHNYFLFMLVEQGYPAMLLYAILIVAIFFYGQKVYHKLNEPLDKTIVMSSMCMIAALFVNNFFSDLLETDKMGSLFLLGIAAIIAIDLRSRKIEYTH